MRRNLGPTDDFMQLYVVPNDGRTLVVGSKVYESRVDERKKFKDALGVDMLDGHGVDLVHNMECPMPESAGRFDHVECRSVLEHAKQPWLVAMTIEDVMQPGASIFVGVPWVWRYHGYPDDYWRFTPSSLAVLFPRIDWKIIKLVTCRKVADKLPSIQSPAGDIFFERTQVMGFGYRSRTA